MGYRTNRCDCFCEYYVWVCRIWGIITAIGLWGIGVEIAYRKYPLGAYLLSAAFVMSMLESVFVIHFFLTLCGGIDNKVLSKLWQAVLWFDDWKKGVFYILMSIFCFIKPHTLWLALISGGMLLVSSGFYCLKTYKTRMDRIADERARNQTYDRFDEVQDDIDENMVDDDDMMPDSGRLDCLADQDEILDV